MPTSKPRRRRCPKDHIFPYTFRELRRHLASVGLRIRSLYYAYKPDFDAKKLKEAIDALLDLQMEVEEISRGLLKRSAEMAFDTGVTIYDAAPIAAAEKRKALCVTADGTRQHNHLR